MENTIIKLKMTLSTEEGEVLESVPIVIVRELPSEYEEGDIPEGCDEDCIMVEMNAFMVEGSIGSELEEYFAYHMKRVAEDKLYGR